MHAVGLQCVRPVGSRYTVKVHARSQDHPHQCALPQLRNLDRVLGKWRRVSCWLGFYALFTVYDFVAALEALTSVPIHYFPLVCP